MAHPTPDGVATMFDRLADVYDQEGVDWFQPIGRRLVDLLEPRPGDRALDIGAGRGAATFPLCRAVGSTGTVTAVDVAPRMIEFLGSDARALGISNLSVVVGDVGSAALRPGSFDVVSASLVLFFCPDPASELTRWLDLVRPGSGRLGVSTFGARSEAWREVDALFDPFLPEGMLDARTSGQRGPFASSDSLAALFAASGAVVTESVVEEVEVRFADVDAWRRWTMTLGQRAMWEAVPEEVLPRFLDAAGRVLDAARDADGTIRLAQDVRFTLAGRRR